jgi:hypothetical protein
MRILWQNLIDDGSSYTPYSEDANYPVSNLYDTRLSRVYRSLAAVATEYILVNESCAPQYVGLINHNVSSSATIYVEGGSSSGLSTLTYSTTFTWSSYTMLSTQPSTVACTYHRIRVVGSTTSTQIQIGYLFMGNYIELPGMKNDQETIDEVTSKITVSDSGQAYGDDGYRYRSFTINFPYVTQSQRTSVRTMFATIKNYQPVITVIWPGNTTYETPIYSIIDSKNLSFKRTDDYNLPWTFSLKIREVF